MKSKGYLRSATIRRALYGAASAVVSYAVVMLQAPETGLNWQGLAAVALTGGLSVLGAALGRRDSDGVPLRARPGSVKSPPSST